MPRNPFHLVDLRPWPFSTGLRAFIIAVGIVSWFHNYGIFLILLGSFTIGITLFQWWRDVSREATFLGAHTSYVARGLRWGIILFILSEVCFFVAFFWAFFHRRLAPTPELGCCWPPVGITPINPFRVPLLNTAVLLASGVTVTWAHHRLIEGNRPNAIQALALTVGLGIYFTFLQVGEYVSAPFTIADGIYGTTFYVSTGFHGLHVIIGTIFLSVCLARLVLWHFSPGHHFGFEAAAWYWHFVDVVWICLYLCIYWWGA